MQATLGQLPLTGRPMRGTFYPSEGKGPGSIGSAVPKLIAIVVGTALVRAIVAGKRGGRSGWSRRREAIDRLHRELHARDAGEEVTA